MGRSLSSLHSPYAGDQHRARTKPVKVSGRRVGARRWRRRNIMQRGSILCWTSKNRSPPALPVIGRKDARVRSLVQPRKLVTIKKRKGEWERKRNIHLFGLFFAKAQSVTETVIIFSLFFNGIKILSQSWFVKHCVCRFGGTSAFLFAQELSANWKKFSTIFVTDWTSVRKGCTSCKNWITKKN